MTSQRAGRLLLWPAVLVGISVVGSLDEIVLHQRCAGTLAATGGCQAAGPIADGVFHVLGVTAMLVAGLMLLVQRWRARSGPLRRAMAGILLGLAAATCMTACGTSCWA